MSKIGSDVLGHVTDKKFTEFSAAVKQSLKDKLANHKNIKKYVSDYDKINQMKNMFNKITTINKHEETKEPETKEPETKEPETKEPETKEPETKEPETKEPETKEPETN